MSKYTAIETFHHPDGVLLPGETAELPEEVADRGLAAGAIGVSETATPIETEPVVDDVPDDKE